MATSFGYDASRQGIDDEPSRMELKSSLPIGLWCHNWMRTSLWYVNQMKRSSIQERIGNTLRKHRESKGISQEAFAEQVHMHRTYYSAIERGEKNLTLSTLTRVCVGLGIPVWSIVKDAEE
jgi:DNA-binding XRE family transcriptional regulator